MAVQDTYTRYTIDDRSPDAVAFSRGADEGRPELMGGPQIVVPDLSRMLAGFDQQPQPPAPGSFVRQIELEANEWGREFGGRVAEATQAAKSYWAPPVTAAPPAKPKATALDSIGSMADSFANSMTGSAPQQAGVETSALGGSLRGSFGQLADSKPEDGLSAFERRYQAETQPGQPKRKGPDYV